MEGAHGCPALARARAGVIVLSGSEIDKMGGRAVRARLFWTAGMVLMTIGQSASANAAPRDRFFWLSQINKASAVMIV